MDMDIQGAGGGGSSNPSAPVISPDSLHSIAYFRILDLVSEGEIVGLVNGQQSIYFNNTPLANSDGTLNFQNVFVDSRTGTQAQTYITGYPAVENETSVGVELKSGTPWVQSLTDLTLSAVRVTLSVPQLSQQDTSNGNVNGYTINYLIEVQTDGGAWVTAVTTAFTGKTTSKYQRSHRIDLPHATTGWQLRVTRTTANQHSTTIADTTTIDSYTEIVDAKLAYPNSALVAVSGDASTFSNIPTRAYDLFGRIIQVPSNYDPLTRAYTGVWDGSFKPAWSNNPAWVFYDLVTHPRYGLGNLVAAAQIDKWALYAIAQYCDQTVPDGKGGQEPRFTCNVFLQTAADAYKLLSDLASAFRGITYWANGAISASADVPSDPAYLYTAANVIDGAFTYASSPRKTRYTTALVTWNDPANMYQQAVEYVQDDVGIARYGIQPAQITAFGCSSQGQAQRAGQWMLLTSRLETETVTFSVGLDGVLAAPGQIIRVQDQARAGKRQGGRIHAATTTAITVDRAPDTVAVGDSLTCTLPTGVTETHAITAIAGNVLSVAAPGFSEAPNAEAGWVTESVTLAAQTFRVVSVKEDDKQGEISFTISAVQHVAGKFATIDGSAILQPPPPITNLPATVQAPVASVTVAQNVVIVQGTAQTVATISWPAATGADHYQVEWRRDAGDWISAGATSGLSVDVLGVYSGSYVARVSAVSASGVTSLPTLSAATAIVGKTVPNAPPTLTATGGQLQIALSWAWPAGVNVEDTNYTEVWVSPTSTQSDGASVGAVAYPGTSYTISGLLPQQQRWAWVRLVDKSQNIGPWSLPANAIGGTVTDLFKPLQDQITTAQSDVDAAMAQVQVLQGQVSDILQADTWDGTKTYPKGDLVQYGGQLFRSLIDGNLNHQPVSSTTDANWEYIGNYASLGEAVGATAANVATLQNTATQQGNTITANSQSIAQNAAAIGNKADASALTATNATVTSQGGQITANAADIALLGAHTADKSAFVLDQNKVQVGGGETFAQMLSGLQASDGALGTRVDNEQAARISGDSANASAITSVQAKSSAAPNKLLNPTFAQGMANWTQGSGPALAPSDSPNWGPILWRYDPAIGGGAYIDHDPVPINAGNLVTGTADVLNLTTGYSVLYLIFRDASGTWLATPSSANDTTPHDFDPTDQQRFLYPVQGTAPAGAVDVILRVQWVFPNGTAIGVRRCKLEIGNATNFSDDATINSSASATQQLTAGTTIGGTAYAAATTMVDANGRIGGTRLASNGTVSSFTVVADQFAVVAPNGGARLEWSGGNQRVYDTNGTLRSRWGVW